MRRALKAAPSTLGVGEIGPAVIEPLAEHDGRLPIPSLPALSRGPRLSRSELGLLALFGLVSLWVLGCDLWQVLFHGQVWTGTDGIYFSDQAQYLGWVVSAAHSGLVADLFVMHPTAAVYFQPAVAISGVLVDVGISPTAALLVWKPVAVLGLFFAARAFVAETLPDAGPGARLAALALALFYGSFSSVYGSFGVVGDLFPGFLAWGYPFALLGVACSAGAMVSYARARRAGRMSGLPALLGALAASMHPWQGEVLILVLVASELSEGGLRGGVSAVVLAVRRRQPRLAGSPRARLAASTVTATFVPLVYLYLLGKLDASWSLGQAATKHAFPGLAILLVVAPIGAVALLGLPLRRRPGSASTTFLLRVAWFWPLAALLVYLQSLSSQGGAPQHAVDGITLPLGVLAVSACRQRGWRRLPHHAVLAWVLILIFTVPTTLYEMKLARLDVRPTPGNGNFIRPAERDALDWLKHAPAKGGVLTRFYLGELIPGRTGRHTYVGNCIWSQPACNARSNLSRALLLGHLSPATARTLVTSSRARFVLADCGDNSPRLATELAPLLESVHRFGCATVYELRA